MCIVAAYEAGYEISEDIDDDNVNVVLWGLYLMIYIACHATFSLMLKWALLCRKSSEQEKTMKPWDATMLGTLHAYSENVFMMRLLIGPLLTGTVLYNMYLNAMGANVSSSQKSTELAWLEWI